MSKADGGESGCCGVLAAAALGVFDQCERLLADVPDAAYAAPSARVQGGTVGKHLRHVLDHYSALLNGVEVAPVVYDRRERNVAMESDRAAAAAAISSLRERLRAVSGRPRDAMVRLRVMVTHDGEEIELRSTLGRELAFATHHAIHHQAMMRAIAQEFGVTLHADFGVAPSTVRHARSTASA